MYNVNNLREFLSLKKKDNYLNDGKTIHLCVCVDSSFIFSLKFFASAYQKHYLIYLLLVK